MRILTATFYFLCCILVWAEEPNKHEEKTALPELKEIVVSGPYCGIYAFVAILDTFNIQPYIEELLVPEYVGSFQGSSNLELIKAAEKYKLGHNLHFLARVITQFQDNFFDLFHAETVSGERTKQNYCFCERNMDKLPFCEYNTVLQKSGETNKLNKFKCVIFDVDGTIVDSIPLCVEAFRLAAEPVVKRSLSDEEITSAFGPSDEGTIRVIVSDAAESCLEQFLYHYRRLHSVMCPKPFDGMVDLLDWLKSRQIPIGLVTGKGPKSLAITLEELNLTHYFDAIETGSPLCANKPECLQSILDKFQLSPGEAVYIGDMPSDITACREVSIPIYSAAWAQTVDIPKLQALKPDKIVYSVAELKTLLQEQCYSR